MSLAATASNDAREMGRSLWQIIADKSGQACYVEWCVGTIILALYIGGPTAGAYTVQEFLAIAGGIWPLVMLAGITRIGETITRSVYWIRHGKTV